jgi:hypothetical protein
MPENRIDSASVGLITTTKTDFSVDSAQTDAAMHQPETRWQDTKYTTYLGYYFDEKVPEITALIDAKATWTVGKGIKADPDIQFILDSIRGYGYDTFNSIMENAMRVMLIGGNFYAEIIRDDDEDLINLKPLDPATIVHVSGPDGMLKRFEQTSKVKGTPNRKFNLDQIFYLPRNRVADEIHGRGIIQKLKLILDMKNEAMADQRKAMHWNVIPRWKFKLKTDDPTEIAAYKTKMDTTTGTGANIYEPFDVSESELISVPANSTLSPIAWIQYLDNLLYQTAGVPKIVVGGSSEFTEKASSIVYLAFQQSVEEEQLFIEEQVGQQLGMEIELEFPVSLENELLSDQKKDQSPTTVQPNETTAGAGQ